MSKRRQIGTVDVLRDRVYDDFSVPAGTYPVMRENGEIFFRLSGYRIMPAGQAKDEGGGLFSIAREDRLESNAAVDFDSPKRWSPPDFVEFLAHPVCNPGEEQRLIITLTEEL